MSITATSGGWGYYTYTNTSALPAGVTNLKVHAINANNYWDPEIGQVSMTHS